MTDDEMLSAAWASFCDRLKALGEIPFRPTAPDGGLDRMAAFRLLASNLSLALEFNYSNKDPRFPELMRVYSPLRKQAGDNGDAIYLAAPISPGETYRISGQLGSAKLISFSLVNEGESPWGGRVASILSKDDILAEQDGSFELMISPEPQPGNSLRSAPGVYRLMIRQFFADWEGEAPMKARIDRMGGDAQAPSLDVAAFAEGLVESARWLGESVTYFADMLDHWKARPNAFLSYAQVNNKIGNTPGGEAQVAYWEMADDEAIIIRVHPPAIDYWAVEFGNYWKETMDYRYRLSGTNCHQAWLEDDGELILVIARDDPGLPNWLDAAGYGGGYVTFRWMAPGDHPTPVCERVKRLDLLASLPAHVRRISPEQRVEQLHARRRGVVNRFGHY